MEVKKKPETYVQYLREYHGRLPPLSEEKWNKQRYSEELTPHHVTLSGDQVRTLLTSLKVLEANLHRIKTQLNNAIRQTT